MTGGSAPAPVQFADGATTTARIWRPAAPDRVPFVIVPAMGVRASFYEPVCAALAACGHGVINADQRGHGASSLRPRDGDDYGFREILQLDIPALVGLATETYGRAPRLLGHSLGGQLSCLYAGQQPGTIDGVAIIACASLWWRRFPLWIRHGIWGFNHFARQTARAAGYWPGPRFRFGGNEATRLVRDWSAQGLTGRYSAVGMAADLDADLAGVELPVLAINIADDWYAPQRATDHLLAKMPRAAVTRARITPQDLGVKAVKHFGWQKHPAVVAPMISQWARPAED